MYPLAFVKDMGDSSVSRSDDVENIVSTNAYKVQKDHVIMH